MVGRLEVAPRGAALDEPAKPIEVAELLKGDNSEEAFSHLVREHARSGVSGVLPKFLDTEQKKQVGLGPHKKATLLTHQHIIKGASSRLPFATANEHLCMQQHRELSKVRKLNYRKMEMFWSFIDSMSTRMGNPFRAIEDFCAPLGLRPSNKYETTWERIAKAVRQLPANFYVCECNRDVTTTTKWFALRWRMLSGVGKPLRLDFLQFKLFLRESSHS
jgi:serine/threonine-protein kinase HipA